MKKWEMKKMDLTGSEKQIRWATEIVADIYATANANVKRAHDLSWPHADKLEEGFDKIISQLEAFLSRVDQAGVIITQREKFSGERILNLANKYVNGEALK